MSVGLRPLSDPWEPLALIALLLLALPASADPSPLGCPPGSVDRFSYCELPDGRTAVRGDSETGRSSSQPPRGGFYPECWYVWEDMEWRIWRCDRRRSNEEEAAGLATGRGALA